jgi:hypothetical protein
MIVGMSLSFAFGAIGGPLGLDKGMRLDDLNRQGSFAPARAQFQYTSKTLVNGHPDFEAYSVLVTPEHGLCKVKAIGKDIESSSFGSELESKFKELMAALTRKYGAPGSTYDFLRSGSIWKDSRDWMMAMLKKERTLAAFWTPPNNSSLPDSLESIKIEATALSPSKGFISIDYEFNNISECLESVKAKKNSNL